MNHVCVRGFCSGHGLTKGKIYNLEDIGDGKFCITYDNGMDEYISKTSYLDDKDKKILGYYLVKIELM